MLELHVKYNIATTFQCHELCWFYVVRIAHAHIDATGVHDVMCVSRVHHMQTKFKFTTRSYITRLRKQSVLEFSRTNTHLHTCSGF